MQILFCYLIPCFDKYSLKFYNFIAFYSAMHIMPFTDNICAVDIIVSHIHTASISNLAIYDNNLSVVAREHMVNPRKAQRVELVNLYATFP